MINWRREVLLALVIVGGVMIIAAGLTWANLSSPGGEVLTPTPASAAEVPRVSIADARQALDSGAAVFVDVRDSASYEKAHIPGALLIPVSELRNHLNELDPAQWIITYCT